METIVSFRRPAFLISILAIMISSTSFAQGKKELDIVFKAIQTKNYELLKPLLDPKVKIHESIPIGMNDVIIPQILKQFPKAIRYSLLKTEKVGKNKRFVTQYVYKDIKKTNRFEFNPHGKIVVLDILGEPEEVEVSTITTK